MGMLIPLLSLALAVAPTPTRASVSDELGPARRGQIEAMAAEWTTYRNRANRMMTAYAAAAAREGWNAADLSSQLGKLRVLLASVENEQASIADIARETIRASEPPSAARSERERAVAAIHEARALTLYGNFVPRILDEAIKDRHGRNDGRRFCGPEWAIVITMEEVGAYGRWQLARAGFTPGQYDAFGDQARTQLGLPPAQR